MVLNHFLTVEYTIPKTEAPEEGWSKGSLASYLGARIGVGGIWIDSCYLRGIALVYNEWFRSENVTEPAAISLGDATTSGSNGTDYVVDIEKGGMPPKAAKYADYFTRALPAATSSGAVMAVRFTFSLYSTRNLP